MHTKDKTVAELECVAPVCGCVWLCHMYTGNTSSLLLDMLNTMFISNQAYSQCEELPTNCIYDAHGLGMQGHYNIV